MLSIRLTPITAEIVAICVAVYIGCSLQSLSNRQPFSEVQRAWYAVLDCDFSEVHDGVRRAKELELHGPFDAWNGDWWRIPITVFHHGNLWSLVLYLGATSYLGSRLERRWGSLGFAAFLAPAISVPVMAELCLGHACMGLSGLACAMLGALVVLQHYDEEVAKDFSEDAGEVGMAIILIGWLATLSDAVSIPNVANLVGFAYGALMMGIIKGPLRKVAFLRVSTVLAHIWLAPALFLVCHPYWIGRYHWYQAVTTKNLHRAERSLERAVQCDRSLTGAWLQFAHLSEERQEPSEAWRRLINGLSSNPASARLIDSTRRLWRHLDLTERRDAELFLVQVFGRRMADEWLIQIRVGATTLPENSNEGVIIENPTEDVGQFALDRKVELPVINNPGERSSPQNRKIQIEQNAAVEGETL